MTPPRTLVLDIGNVLLRFDFGSALRRIAPHCQVPVLEGLAASEAIKHDYESGRIGRREFLDRVFERLGYTGPEEGFVRAWNEIFTENVPMTRIVRALHGRLPMFLLSNTSDLHMEYIRETFEVFGLLPEGVYSWEARCMKPEPEIFRLAIERLGLDPAATIYVDDLAPNIATARALGFRCVPYDPDRHDAALAEMRRFGLEV